MTKNYLVLLLTLAIAVLALAACGAPATPTAPATATRQPAASPTTAPSTATPVLPAATAVPATATRPAATPDLAPTPTSPAGVTVSGIVALGYGDHSVATNVPIWAGKEARGDAIGKVAANGRFEIDGFPAGERNILIGSDVFEAPAPAAAGKSDLGLLTIPPRQLPAYYRAAPAPLPDLTALLAGAALPFTVCETDETWQKPTPEQQSAQVWARRPFGDQTEPWLRWWFDQKAIVYDSINLFKQSFPGGPAVDGIGADRRLLLGIWTAQGPMRNRCDYASAALQDLFTRKQVEVWLLGYQAQEARRLGQHVALPVKAAPGYQILRFAYEESPLTIHLVENGHDVVQLPTYCYASCPSTVNDCSC